MLKPGTQLNGEKSSYTIAQLLASGAQSEVYSARGGRFSQAVAIKVIRDNSFIDVIRFLEECVALERLEHPNIVRILDSSPAFEKPAFIVMELLQGENLQQYLAKTQFTQQHAVIAAKEIMKGVSKAHDHGIIHRDLKPGNIFITNEGFIKIMDFGLAHRQDGSWQGGGGTVLYMSPEQAQKQNVTFKTDIFSFGSVFYEFLHHKQAFTSLDEVVACKPVYDSKLPNNLKNILMNCHQKDPRNRPTAREVLGLF